jgi:transposase
LLIHGIRPVIPPKANRKDPPSCDFKVYKDRNRIERMFNRLNSSDGLPPGTTRPELPSKRSFRWPPQKSGCRTS